MQNMDSLPHCILITSIYESWHIFINSACTHIQYVADMLLFVLLLGRV